jgi:hypothetical protein
MEVAIRELLRMQNPDFYRNRTFRIVSKWDMCFSVLGDVEKQLYFRGML